MPRWQGQRSLVVRMGPPDNVSARPSQTLILRDGARAERNVTFCNCLHVQLKTTWFPGMTGATAKAKYNEAHCMGYC
jgi:hypothetical protein